MDAEAVKPSESVVVYSNGIVHCSVCVPKEMSREEIERLVNLENPSGTMDGWQIDEAPTFAAGSPNPGPCDKFPAERLHYLMVC